MASTVMRKSSARPTAHEYLEGVRASVIRLEQLREKVAMLGERLDGAGTVGCGRDRAEAPCGCNVAGRRVMLYQEAKRALDEQEARCGRLLGQAAAMLRAMVDAGCPADVADEVEYYYCWAMSTSEIALAVHASESCVRMHRARALAAAGPCVPPDAT